MKTKRRVTPKWVGAEIDRPIRSTTAQVAVQTSTVGFQHHQLWPLPWSSGGLLRWQAASGYVVCSQCFWFHCSSKFNLVSWTMTIMVKPLSLPLLLYLDKHHDWLAGSLLKGKSFHGCLKFQSLVCLCWKIYLRRPQHLSFSLAQTLCSFFMLLHHSSIHHKVPSS